MSTLRELAAEVRTSPTKDDALRASLKAKGWLQHLPGIKDGRGVILVGNRRNRLCQELEIEPVFITVTGLSEEECLRLATASNIGGAGMTKEDRKRLAEKLFTDHNYTQQQIAAVIGVSQMQISRDLEDLNHGLNQRRAPTATNPRGAGRPHGSGGGRRSPRRSTTEQVEASAATLVLDEGLTLEQASARVGVGVQIVKTSVAREEGRREARNDPEVDPATLSQSAQQRLEAAIRQHKRQLDMQFEERLRHELSREIDGRVLPSWGRRLKEADLIVKSRRGALKDSEFRLLLSCLHPDDSASLERRRKAFDLLQAKRLALCGERELPTEAAATSVPRNWSEWQNMRTAPRRRGGRGNVERRG